MKKTVPVAAPLFTVSGQEETLLIVGLGNIGTKYDGTRHNIGFTCLDTLAKQQSLPEWTEKKSLKCRLIRATLGDKAVILAKPTTFMNESGQAVKAIQHYYKISNKNTVIVHDELDVTFGQIRTRIGGSAAGNNGIKSIIQHCHEDFGRVRVGVNNDHLANNDAADFVLAPFNKDEKSHLGALNKEVQSILVEFVYRGALYPETRSFIV